MGYNNWKRQMQMGKEAPVCLYAGASLFFVAQAAK
jgi:hypothetical protein